MTKNVFYSDLDSFCRKYLVKVEGVTAPDPQEFGRQAVDQQASLFENLILFDKISFKVTGESMPISMLIGLLGQSSFDELVEQGAFEFVLWNQRIVHLTDNI